MEAKDRRSIFKGRVINLSVDTVTLPNGYVAQLEVVTHPGGAAAVAVNRDNEVCILEQYRYATGGWLSEIPAGRVEDGEAPIDTARRELEEEAGYIAQRWTSLGWVWSSPGVFTERIYLYLAQELCHVGHTRQEDEVMKSRWIPLSSAAQSAVNGELTDSKTVIGLLRAAAKLTDKPG